MNGEMTDLTEKKHSTAMSAFFRSGSIEERRAIYRDAANTAISLQKAVISAAREKNAQAPRDD
ncbi:hypothetical protein ACW9H6_09280 [Pseudomonas sp. SDO528_S397]